MGKKPGGGQKNEPLSQKRAEALGLALASSMGNVTQMWERQMQTLLAVSAVLAAMPQTAQVDPRKVGAIINLLSAKHANPEKMRDDVTRMAAMILDMSKRLNKIDLPPLNRRGTKMPVRNRRTAGRTSRAEARPGAETMTSVETQNANTGDASPGDVPPQKTLDDLIGRVLDAFPSALASPSGVARARQLARRLPPATSVIYEVPLQGEAAGIDISLRINSRDDTRAVVENRHPSVKLPGVLAEDPVWRRAAAFCSIWRDRRGPLAAGIETVGLEFDDHQSEAGAPQPLIYFSRVRNDLPATIAGIAIPRPQVTLNWVVDPALVLLLGRARAEIAARSRGAVA